MQSEGGVHWSPLETATLKVRKKGGLAQGYHELSTGYKYSSSYIPPKLQASIDNEEPDPLFAVLGFGKQHEDRRLLIV